MAFPKIKRIFLDLTVHVIITCALALAVYSTNKNLFYVFLSVMGGIFIDLDHFVDHFLYHKNIFNIKDFFACTHLKAGKMYIPLHSWELMIALGATGFIFKSGALLVLCLAMSLHLLADTCWRKNKFSYFLAYRIFHKFNAKILLSEFY